MNLIRILKNRKGIEKIKKIGGEKAYDITYKSQDGFKLTKTFVYENDRLYKARIETEAVPYNKRYVKCKAHYFKTDESYENPDDIIKLFEKSINELKEMQ
jgi:predicted glycosyltransferase